MSTGWQLTQHSSDAGEFPSRTQEESTVNAHLTSFWSCHIAHIHPSARLLWVPSWAENKAGCCARVYGANMHGEDNKREGPGSDLRCP